jgi:hypothetical protein
LLVTLFAILRLTWARPRWCVEVDRGRVSINQPSHASAGYPSMGWPEFAFQRILDGWPTLPEPLRRAMLALVESGC